MSKKELAPVVAPKVSVVMPSFNVVKYIRECMDSVLGQTLKEIEVFVVDASSTDGTREILEEYQQKDSRVHILNDDKNSTGYANNKAIDAATGEYIAIVETDDFIAPNMFERLYEVAKANDLDIVKGDYDSFSGDGEKRKYVHHNMLGQSSKYNRVLIPMLEENIFDVVMFNWAGIYKRSFLNKYNIRHNETPGASFQDNGFFFQAYACAKAVCFLHESFYRYRKDNPNSSINRADKVYCMCEEYDFVERKLAAFPEIWYKVFIRYLRRRYASCSWLLKKVAPQFREDLVKRMHDDFVLRIRNHEDIDKIEGLPKYNEELRLLLRDEKEYMKKLFEGQDEYPVRFKKLCRKLRRYGQIVLFGAGEHGNRLQVMLKNAGIDVSCFTDNSALLPGKEMNGVPICSVCRCIEKYPKAFYIIAMEFHHEEVKNQLLHMGVLPENILLYFPVEYIWD